MQDTSGGNPAQSSQDSQAELTQGISRMTTRSISGSSSISRHNSGSSDKYSIVVEGLVVQEGQKVYAPMNCVFVYMENNTAQKKDVRNQLTTIEADAEITDRKTEGFRMVCEISKRKITNPITGVSSIHKGMKTALYKTKEQKEKEKKKQEERKALVSLGKAAKKRKQQEEEADTSDEDYEAPAKRIMKKEAKKPTPKKK